MRHRHRWPYIVSVPLLLFLPSLLAVPTPSPIAKTRHNQRQLYRLVGGHYRIPETDQNDSELITASAGDERKASKQSKGGDERKSLSQQVADGKYGLIQKELFKKVPKRPGILSYAANPEVPNDNIATLGGLTKSDIWLAENHLLVIRGGSYPPHDDPKQDGQTWQPIDDYDAPLHQVKIPKNPKVPPPFPVQLTDDGPLQIIGTNSSRTLNASAETPAYALPPPPGWDGEIPPQNEYFPQAGAPGTDQADPVAGKTALRVPGSGEPPGGLPFPPVLLNGSSPPSFAHLPPGAAILPAPLGNETDQVDEDDPSIYYPPPYSFYYPKDNSSVVPPGPLVPGIILPPPPKFFAPLEEDSVTTTTTTRTPIYATKYTSKQSTTTTSPPTTTTEAPLSNEISTSKSYKTVPTKVSVVKNYSKVTVRVNTSRRPQDVSRGTYKARPQTTKLIKTTLPTTGKPKFMTILPVHVDRLNRTYLPTRKEPKTKIKPPVTILRPIKTDVAPPQVYSYRNEVSDRPFDRTKEQKNVYDNQTPQFNRIEVSDRPFDRTKEQKNVYDNQTPHFNRIKEQQPAYVKNKDRPYGQRQEERQKDRFNGGYVSTTQVPLRYTTMHDIRSSTVTPGHGEFSIGTRLQNAKTTPKQPANYYFYEETDPVLNDITTNPPRSNQDHDLYHHYHPTSTKPPLVRKPYQNDYTANHKPTTEQPVTGNYYPVTQSSPRPTVKPQYIYVSGRPYESEKPKFRYVPQREQRPQQNTFSVHVATLQHQLHQYYPSRPSKRPSSRPVYQYSFEAEKYRRPVGGSFRPSPLMDDSEDSFRPIPKYSVEVQPAIEIIPTHRPDYQQVQHLSVEEPGYYSTGRHNRPGYYSTQRPQYEQYHQETSGYRQSGQTYQQQPEIRNNPDVVVTPSKPIAEFSFDVTPNPVHQGFYTKPDEGYFDENTKQYFTIFGRKLPTATTPLPPVERPQSNGAGRYRHQQQYDRPVSLESDINVNYVRPRPPVNPLSEPYRHQEDRPEVIKAVEITPAGNSGREKDRYIHYQLPGDEGAHFYFLTPQGAERRRQGYFYETDRRVKREREEEERNR